MLHFSRWQDCNFHFILIYVESVNHVQVCDAEAQGGKLANNKPGMKIQSAKKLHEFAQSSPCQLQSALLGWAQQIHLVHGHRPWIQSVSLATLTFAASSPYDGLCACPCLGPYPLTCKEKQP